MSIFDTDAYSVIGNTRNLEPIMIDVRTTFIS